MPRRLWNMSWGGEPWRVGWSHCAEVGLKFGSAIQACGFMGPTARAFPPQAAAGETKRSLHCVANYCVRPGSQKTTEQERESTRESEREREREEIYLDMEQWWYMSFSPSAADQYLHAMVLGVHRSMSWCNELMPLGRIATTAQTESHHCERRIAKSYIMIPKLTSECNSCHIQSETKKLLNVIPRVFLKLRPVTEKKKLNHQ